MRELFISKGRGAEANNNEAVWSWLGRSRKGSGTDRLPRLGASAGRRGGIGSEQSPSQFRCGCVPDGQVLSESTASRSAGVNGAAALDDAHVGIAILK